VRIGIDVRKEWDGGIGRYIRNLVSGLESAGEVEKLHVWAKPGSRMFHRHSERFYPHVEKAGLYRIWEQVSLARKVKRVDIDLYHEPHYVIPFSTGVPLIVTVHDVIHLVFPKGPLYRIYAALQMGHAVRNARAIITPSEFSRRELIRFFPKAAGKTFPILHGLEASFSPESTGEDERIKQMLGLPEAYLFYVGNHKPHKNLLQLLDICREVFKRYPMFFLCLTGNKEDEGGAVNSAASQHGFENRVRFLGDLDNETLQVCYRHARVFVFPSLYEGFGFPPLEAMACGTPVVAFRVASLPEVIGDGGILVPPQDGKAFYDALTFLLQDSEARSAWGTKGVLRARKFRWEHSLHEHLSLYHRVLSGPLV